MTSHDTALHSPLPGTAAKGLRRPALLVRAARAGLADYDRGRDLPRLLRRTSAPPAAEAAAVLSAEEAVLDARRRAGSAAYSAPRHVAVLIALMAEFRLETRPAGTPSPCLPAGQTKASGISALRRATKSASASSTAGSIAGLR